MTPVIYSNVEISHAPDGSNEYKLNLKSEGYQNFFILSTFTWNGGSHFELMIGAGTDSEPLFKILHPFSSIDECVMYVELTVRREEDV
jgi:hypothetical protein